MAFFVYSSDNFALNFSSFGTFLHQSQPASKQISMCACHLFTQQTSDTLAYCSAQVCSNTTGHLFYCVSIERKKTQQQQLSTRKKKLKKKTKFQMIYTRSLCVFGGRSVKLIGYIIRIIFASKFWLRSDWNWANDVIYPLSCESWSQHCQWQWSKFLILCTVTTTGGTFKLHTKVTQPFASPVFVDVWCSFFFYWLLIYYILDTCYRT